MELIEIVLYIALPILGVLNLITIISILCLSSAIKKKRTVTESDAPIIKQNTSVKSPGDINRSLGADVSDDMVTFSSEKALTIEDKYLELNSEEKNYYDEIIQHATKVEGARRFKNARYEEYKVGKNRLVRLLIKRGIVVCEFILPNSDFKNYVNENKLKIKAAPTVLKVVSAETVKIAKDSIDIAVKAIEAEKTSKNCKTRLILTFK